MSIEGIIGRAIPSVASVSEVRAVHSPRHHRHFEARLSDGSVLTLHLPPPPMAKLLRSERAASVSAEAAVLAWLGSLGEDNGHYRGDSAECGAPRDGNLQLARARQHVLAENGPTEAHRSRGASQPAVAQSDIPFAPALVAHSPAHTLAGPEFNVVKPAHGFPVASLSPPLSPAERAAVDFQNGCLMRRLSRLRSPSGKFGPALGVLGGRAPPSSSRKVGSTAAGGAGSAAAWEPGGSSTWAVALASMLEGVLRDGEDMHVNLPYSSIRQHFWRLRHLLGAVTNACLVVVDAGEDDNILVVRKGVSKSLSKSGGTTKRLGGKSSGDGDVDKRKKNSGQKMDSRVKGKSKEEREKKRHGHTASDPDGTDGDVSDSGPACTGTEQNQDIVVTGMHDWSNCVFGDPLFAAAFHRRDNDQLWSGFTSPQGGESGVDPVQDAAHAQTRMLLYECYHTVTQVVREFYRPGKDSSKRELAARRALNGVMGRLDRVSSERSRRHRRPSGEMSPAKRYKTDEDEDENDDEGGVLDTGDDRV
ncbi:hypothetical protein VUR80DRAFT_5681 [Thermomyces stellatus]